MSFRKSSWCFHICCFHILYFYSFGIEKSIYSPIRLYSKISVWITTILAIRNCFWFWDSLYSSICICKSLTFCWILGYCGHIPMAMSRFGECSKSLTHGALSEFVHNYRRRKSAEWCPLEMAGVATSCPSEGHFVIYHRTTGMIPKYAGHVPGEAFTFGRTYGNATVDAKRWIALHKS